MHQKMESANLRTDEEAKIVLTFFLSAFPKIRQNEQKNNI